jgi:hypothetical protein
MKIQQKHGYDFEDGTDSVPKYWHLNQMPGNKTNHMTFKT